MKQVLRSTEGDHEYGTEEKCGSLIQLFSKYKKLPFELKNDEIENTVAKIVYLIYEEGVRLTNKHEPSDYVNSLIKCLSVKYREELKKRMYKLSMGLQGKRPIRIPHQYNPDGLDIYCIGEHDFYVNEQIAKSIKK